jgi:hypothetical protein
MSGGVTYYLVLGVALVFFSIPTGFAVECGMTHVATHIDPGKTKIFASTKGIASLYYSAKMAVNTDGASKSYHPDDPHGKKLAYNNIANAISRIFDASGKDITCGPRVGECYARFIKTFEAARDAKYNPKAHPRISTDGMIPWKKDSELGWNVPCRNQSEQFKGYFISATSLTVNQAKDVCDQARYLDSLIFNAVVLPLGVQWIAQGVPTDDGDLVVVRDTDNGNIAFAINGDRGPRDAIGEGTIALTAKLSGVNLSGQETYEEIRKLARSRVQYVTFPKDDIRRLVGKEFTQSDVEKVGKTLLDAWGGLDRLTACTALK